MGSKGYASDFHSHNILINGHCQSRRVHEAIPLFAEMSDETLTPGISLLQHIIEGNLKFLKTSDITWHNLPTPQFMPDWSPPPCPSENVRFHGFPQTHKNQHQVILVIILESISLLSTTEKLAYESQT
uniref:Pentatricopeptide repeat-containing protein n=1 Tax=Salix viminalis TaxID=40686 RepID=A0A6N2N737_SALVM